MPSAKEKEEIVFKIKGKKWKMRFVKTADMPKSYGECDDPSYFRPEIWINRNIKGKEKLDTIVHELLHATHPELSEDSVSETASKISEVLHKAGLRFID